MTVSDVRPIRCAAFWAMSFVVLYAGSYGLYLAMAASSNPAFYLAVQLLGPATFFLFGYGYFRGLGRHEFALHALVAALWILATLVAFAVLMGPVYHQPWTLVLSRGTLMGQSVHFGMMLLAGFAAKRSAAATLPEGLA